MPDAPELKPCPFCPPGEGDDVYANHNDDDTWEVQCNGCGSCGSPQRTEPLAAAAWNRRHTPDE